MDIDYSIEIQKQLETKLHAAELHRPVRLDHYEAGTELTFDATGVAEANTAQVRLVIDKFVGGGFAGQVYRVKILDIQSEKGPTAMDASAAIPGLEVGGMFAMKILIPPSRFSLFFRNALYWFGFQGPFQLQVNPTAARAGALWQKLIRRGAQARFGNDRAVVDIHATFVDHRLGSCGELSEWVDGRTWRLEVDDRVDLLRRWSRRKQVDESKLGSPEYRTNHTFMSDFVGLLHDMGGHEFARQYEWSTWKSQPNCLKRNDTDASPTEGLTAVDFRAGLALLPFLPMSPGDFKLIPQGIMRGSLVQFDRGNLKTLRNFIDAHINEFEDAAPMLGALEDAERVYRDSVPDITHNHVRLLYSRRLWSTILSSAITGWTVTNQIDEKTEQRFRKNSGSTILFGLLGFIPFLGWFVRRIWGQSFWRKHYAELLSSWDYIKRSVRVTLLEKTMAWHRAGRMNDETAERAGERVSRAAWQLPLSILPAKLHRFLSDFDFAKDRLSYYLIRPIRLYFNAQLREDWLREMVMDGKKDHLLNDEDADIILSQVNEPFIQKYLKSLAVHLCTLPVTQIVSVIIAVVYVLMHPDMPRAQAWGVGVGIIALFQVVPISPGSLVRGLYVVYLVIRERNFKDYNIAVFLGFFKYVGYLAFPIQMAYRYPTLARFMAAHWATGAVHIVPVFGERGALLEHWVFGVFYNWPLTLRRRMRLRAEIRAALEPRHWHFVVCAVAGAAVFGLAEMDYLRRHDQFPTLKQLWVYVLVVPAICGIVVTLAARGTSLRGRVYLGAACGVLMGVLHTAVSAWLSDAGPLAVSALMTNCLWRVFLYGLISTASVLLTEFKLPEPADPRAQH
jgi:hypothetical protein